MDDQVCPRCKTTKYRDPSLKLMVNVCGHALCESCVDLLFLKGSGSCPDCGIPLRRNNFRIQLFEDPNVEKEVDIRKRVLKDFNKKEDDFLTLREYNDYLEFVETIIFNLVNNIDIIETNKKIDNFKKENKEVILKNKSKLGREEYELEEMIEEEKINEDLRRKQQVQEEKEEKVKKMRAKEAMIDELMFSNTDARNIMKTFTETLQAVKEDQAKPKPKPTQFSSGIKFGRQGPAFLPIPKEVEGEPFLYERAEVAYDGPVPPSWDAVDKDGYLLNIRTESEQERAGGYKSNIACMRALQEAFVGLYGT